MKFKFAAAVAVLMVLPDGSGCGRAERSREEEVAERLRSAIGHATAALPDETDRRRLSEGSVFVQIEGFDLWVARVKVVGPDGRGNFIGFTEDYFEEFDDAAIIETLVRQTKKIGDPRDATDATNRGVSR